MTRSLLSGSLFVLLAIGLLSSLGCGAPKGTAVTGKVIVPSQLKFGEGDQVEVTFVPEDSKKPGASGVAKPPDFTFTAATPQTVGVLPGKYKIAVRIAPYLGAPGSEGRTAAFEKVNENFNVIRTKLTYEVTAGAPHDLTIDLTKGTVTKN